MKEKFTRMGTDKNSINIRAGLVFDETLKILATLNIQCGVVINV